jgi:glycosyltransferase involved in cell wall biosynthesis
MRDHPNIIHVDDPSQAQLRFLYERCSAYVCFSRREGYGWSIADGLLAQKPIISRRIGVLSQLSEVEGLAIYETEDQLSEFLAHGVDVSPQYDLQSFSPTRAVRTLETLVAGGRSTGTL